MHKTRLEAFIDGVMAILITIMVLELKIPHGDNLDTIVHLLPLFLSYVLSFVYVGIYWNNHHHMFFAVDKINGKVLWIENSNLYLSTKSASIKVLWATLKKRHRKSQTFLPNDKCPTKNDG